VVELRCVVGFDFPGDCVLGEDPLLDAPLRGVGGLCWAAERFPEVLGVYLLVEWPPVELRAVEYDVLDRLTWVPTRAVGRDAWDADACQPCVET
jgi:hypothetical protein